MPSELWLTVRREGESAEWREEMGDSRVAAFHNGSKGKVVGLSL